MKHMILGVVIAGSLIAGAAQAMSVREFLETASRIPRNPTALLRSDTRRLMGEVRGAMSTLRQEQTAARDAGRKPATCMPQSVPLSANEILQRMEAVPQGRRDIGVTQAMREWMAEKYPCA